MSDNVSSFYPRKAMLARYILWPCVRLSVCLSQAGVLSKRLNGSRSSIPQWNRWKPTSTQA